MLFKEAAQVVILQQVEEETILIMATVVAIRPQTIQIILQIITQLTIVPTIQVLVITALIIILITQQMAITEEIAGEANLLIKMWLILRYIKGRKVIIIH